MIWNIRNQKIDLSSKGMVMGVLNVTPDSFSDGGMSLDVALAVEKGLRMIQEGADIIDIGGESTRPGALYVSCERELERTIPVILAIREKSDIFISIDTSKAEVAKQAIAAGADIVNDVTGLEGDSEMPQVCKEADAAVVVMHMQGTPEQMQDAPYYTNVVEEVRAYFESRLVKLQQLGIDSQRICFDPGIGFGKSQEHNQALMKHLDTLLVEDRPLLLGVSRKSFIGKVLGEESPLERDWATVALTAYGRTRGAAVHRVHEVKKNKESLRMMEAIIDTK